MVLVFAGIGCLAFLSASMLAIDVGMFMNARGQAQNAADAGALAGAVALVFDDFNDRSAGSPAVQNAVMVARANSVMHQQVSVEPQDVTFPTQERVRVTVYRTGGRGTIATLIGQYFGVSNVDISATATAAAAPANAMTCVKPFTIPDKWIENQTPPWGAGKGVVALGDPVYSGEVQLAALRGFGELRRLAQTGVSFREACKIADLRPTRLTPGVEAHAGRTSHTGPTFRFGCDRHRPRRSVTQAPRDSPRASR